MPDPRRSRTDQALDAGVGWLLDLQNRDGGWPTFCRGWGALPFDRSAPDLTAHAIRAIVRWLESRFGVQVQPGLKCGESLPDQKSWRPYLAVLRGFEYLKTVQRADGSWLPLWFGNQHVAHDENPTYGTARVLAAYRDAGWSADAAFRRGLSWLGQAQNPDGGWGGSAGIPSSVEETALALEVLVSVENFGGGAASAVSNGICWLLDRIDNGKWMEPSPIGFYFAKLWYFEKFYPLIFTAGALRRAVGLLGDAAGAETRSTAIDFRPPTPDREERSPI